MTTKAARITELAESMFNQDVRVERAIHIQTMLALPSWDLAEAIDSGDLDGIGRAVGLDITAEDFAQAAKEEELGWLLRDVKGWVLEVSAIKVGPWDEAHRSRAAHPGQRTSRYFTGATYEGALAKAVQWVESDPEELVVGRATVKEG